MPSDSNDQTPLQFSRGGLIVIAVLLGVSWFGSLRTPSSGRYGDPNGLPFGSWNGPRIQRLVDQKVESEQMGLRIDPVPDFAFFFVDRTGDDLVAPNISFINRNESLLGEIQSFDPTRHSWPPNAIDFGDAVNVKVADETAVFDVGPSSDFRMQVQTIRYDDAKITWASPRKSPVWPLRVHLGKCELGGRVLLITVYELEARKPVPDYQAGPIAAIADALRPL
jgi:hypothetical protein